MINIVDPRPIGGEVFEDEPSVELEPVEWNSSESFLICPRCKEPNLHQVQVEASFREREDSVKGHHVRITNKLVAIDTDAEMTNPSGRRDGLTITFCCEFCDGVSDDTIDEWGTYGIDLTIVQHKGQTYLTWNY
tara:strand:- start:1188 stop:1589 length:402 start_codon:yes stop_codon:yes gene_type:complete